MKKTLRLGILGAVAAALSGCVGTGPIEALYGPDPNANPATSPQDDANDGWDDPVTDVYGPAPVWDDEVIDLYGPAPE